jgi:chromosome segregation ATPase
MASPNGQGDTLTIQASEFQRLQSQLIDLRTTNYQLKEEQQRQASEIDQLNDELQTKGRELDKANKVLHRSKKAKEMSSLLEENNSLQQKLQSQEDDFNLQNRTLMEEISRVCEENEGLKTRLKKTGGGEGEGLTRLRAENTALQKSLQMLRGKLSDASNQETQVDGEASVSDVAQPAVLELQLQLDTEKEEKALLLKKLDEVQESARKEQAQLQSQLDMWVEKAKRKQDSFVKLQEEKEKLFVESRASFDAMVRSKEREIQSMQDQVQKLSKDLQTKDEMSSVRAEIAQQLQSLSKEKEEMNLKCNSLIQVSHSHFTL